MRLDIQTGAKIADMNQLEADLAVRLVRPQTGDLSIKSLLNVRMSILGHEDYLARHRHKPIEELDWIGWSHDFDGLFESRWLHQRGIEPCVRFNRILPILEAVRRGIGVAVLGKGLARGFPELQELPHPTLSQVKGSFWLVRPEVHQDNALIGLVAQWVSEVFSNLTE